MLDVRPIDDAAAIHAILTEPRVAAKIRHDGRDPGYIEHPAVTYYGAFVDDALVGVFIAVRFSRWEVEAHVVILPAGLESARELARLFIRSVFADTEVQRITANVLSTLPSAANFCRKLGFVDEGRRRNACRVNGVLTDVVVLGLVP